MTGLRSSPDVPAAEKNICYLLKVILLAVRMRIRIIPMGTATDKNINT
jgi:hypothetical protein